METQMKQQDNLIRYNATFHDSSSVSVDDFKSAFRMHPAGVAVVTADPSGHEPVAMTVSSLASVSTDPPMIMFSVSSLSSSAPVLERSESVVVHLVNADQVSLAKLGATSGVDRFEDRSSWDRLATGEPVFSNVYSWLRGKVVFRLEAGNSTICLVHVLEASVSSVEDADEAPKPLVYFSRNWHELSDQSLIR